MKKIGILNIKMKTIKWKKLSHVLRSYFLFKVHVISSWAVHAKETDKESSQTIKTVYAMCFSSDKQPKQENTAPFCLMAVL